ncbi:MAG: hypothetical protein WA987_12875 [Cellvibrio sp.]
MEKILWQEFHLCKQFSRNCGTSNNSAHGQLEAVRGTHKSASFTEFAEQHDGVFTAFRQINHR